MSGALNASEILELLPHRYPFLLLDRVVELEPGRRGVGIKNLSIDEPFFAGHFPSQPTFPGVLLIEACAQLTAVVCAVAAPAPGEHGDEDGGKQHRAMKIEYMASVERFKFLHRAFPGDQILLESVVGRFFQGLLSTSVRARVNNTVIAEGVLTVTARNGLRR